MKSSLILILLNVFALSQLIAQDPLAYQIFNDQGKPASYKKILKACEEADVVFFGELHNNPISHWLQLELTQDVYDLKDGQLMLGAEMFESDNQVIINEYVLGLIPEKNFEQEVRLWNNYQTDYKPLVNFAKENGLAFVATNIPRRYANMVYKQGLESLETLSEQAKTWIAPLPIDIDMEEKAYAEMLTMGGGNERFPHAQAIKDATMAHFISWNLEGEQSLLHFNGAFHSDYQSGIIFYLKKLRPELKVLVISTVEQEEINELKEENLGKGNFILAVPERMTKTY